MAVRMELRLEEQPTFDLGFDLDASMREKRVTGLREGSRAHAAGLRNGQRLTGWSVYHGQTDRPVTFTIVHMTPGRGRSFQKSPAVFEVCIAESPVGV